MSSSNAIPGPRSGDNHDPVPDPGSLIKVARVRSNLTQAALARRCGVSHSVISRVENGRQTDPHLLRRIAEALGIAPSLLLNGATGSKDAIAGAQRTLLPTTPGIPPPAQLPADHVGFVAREKEFARLSELLLASRRRPTSLPIAVISGTAGVGKSALAVHWAHSVADRFPDGQLYASLRGVDPAGPADPNETLRGFLTALGADPKRLPRDLEGRAAEFRSRLAKRRVLILLDDAHDSNQIRPLLPGGPQCFVLVTSRKELTGLITRDGARPIPLDCLSREDSRRMLARRIDEERMADASAVEAIVRACARLPLALTIAGARAEIAAHLPLSALASELQDSRARLDLMLEEPATNLRAVFSWSYDQLGEDARRLFRLLGLYPGQNVSVAAAASLAALSLPATRALLGELTRSNLVSERTPGRFGCHDLLREYARELHTTLDGRSESDAAKRRLESYYLGSAYRADQVLRPGRDEVVMPPREFGVTTEPLTDAAQALAWFTAEHPALLTVHEEAFEAQRHAYTWQLAWTLDTFLYRQGHWNDHTSVWTRALSAARKRGDHRGAARALRSLARVSAARGNLAEAHELLEEALELLPDRDDGAGRAHTHAEIARVLDREGRHDASLRHAEHALSLFRAAGHRHGQAKMLNDIGWLHAQRGQYQRALVYCTQALELMEELGNHEGAAFTWDSLGFAHFRLGHYDEAMSCYETSVALFQRLGDRQNEATTLTSLGDVQHAAGLPDVRRTWTRALELFEVLRHPKGEEVRAKLQSLDGL